MPEYTHTMLATLGGQPQVVTFTLDLLLQRNIPISEVIVIHLSVSGGRRLMSLLAISAALLKFEHTDHIWHIYTPDAIRKEANEGAIMHAPPKAGIELIEGPFAFWGPYFPNLPQYPNDDVRTIVRTQVAQMDAQERS